MVLDHQGDYRSQWKAINEIGEKLGVHHESLRIWVRKAETDAGHRPGLTSDEREQVKELEREVKELRRANEMAGSTTDASSTTSAASHQRSSRPTTTVKPSRQSRQGLKPTSTHKTRSDSVRVLAEEVPDGCVGVETDTVFGGPDVSARVNHDDESTGLTAV
ncbi:MAG: hypothetical protein ACJAR2_000472, partial [Ilumatobacter sp.]